MRLTPCLFFFAHSPLCLRVFCSIVFFLLLRGSSPIAFSAATLCRPFFSLVVPWSVEITRAQASIGKSRYKRVDKFFASICSTRERFLRNAGNDCRSRNKRLLELTTGVETKTILEIITSLKVKTILEILSILEIKTILELINIFQPKTILVNDSRDQLKKLGRNRNFDR